MDFGIPKVYAKARLSSVAIATALTHCQYTDLAISINKMMQIRVAALLVILVLTMAIPDVETIKMEDPFCLVNECGPPLGGFTLACQNLCKVAGYTSGKCIQPTRSSAKCKCLGRRNSLSLFVADSVCKVLIEPVCKLCGYKGLNHCAANSALNVTRAYCH